MLWVCTTCETALWAPGLGDRKPSCQNHECARFGTFATIRRATAEETAEGRKQLLRPQLYRFQVTFPKGQVRWVRDSDPYPQLVVSERGASEHEESLKNKLRERFEALWPAATIQPLFVHER